jgi:hypothetical protein
MNLPTGKTGNNVRASKNVSRIEKAKRIVVGHGRKCYAIEEFGWERIAFVRSFKPPNPQEI